MCLAFAVLIWGYRVCMPAVPLRVWLDTGSLALSKSTSAQSWLQPGACILLHSYSFSELVCPHRVTLPPFLTSQLEGQG